MTLNGKIVIFVAVVYTRGVYSGRACFLTRNPFLPSIGRASLSFSLSLIFSSRDTARDIDLHALRLRKKMNICTRVFAHYFVETSFPLAGNAR